LYLHLLERQYSATIECMLIWVERCVKESLSIEPQVEDLSLKAAISVFQ
jgi:hypothetical protein